MNARMKRVLRVLLPLLVLIVAGLLTLLMIKSRPDVQAVSRVTTLPLVRAVEVAAREHFFQVHAQGTVAPRTEINLVAEVPGRVMRVSESFTEGGFFEAGETLIELDRRDYELAVTRANASLAEAEVRLQREEAEGEVARQEWESLGEGEPGALLLRGPQLAEARAVVASARANLEIAKLDLERCRIQAPFAGRVRTKRANTGQFVARGEVVGRVYAIDYVEVRLPLSLEDLGFLELPVQYRGEVAAREGPRVVLRARVGNQRHEWEGQIVRTEGEIDTRTRMLTAVARVDDPFARSQDWHRPPLAVGLFVDAEIDGRSAGQVHLAPRAALRLDQRLMVVDRDQRLRFREVEILRFEGESVVFGQGLEAGDRVCISPLEIAVEGMEVRLARSDEPGMVAGEGAGGEG
jgi:membrane fusion protein, multidrug efflux system